MSTHTHTHTPRRKKQNNAGPLACVRHGSPEGQEQRRGAVAPGGSQGLRRAQALREGGSRRPLCAGRVQGLLGEAVVRKGPCGAGGAEGT